MPDIPFQRLPLYRAFHLGRNGGIVRAEIIEAVDDEDAIERVRALSCDHALELWDRTRLVAHIEQAQTGRVIAHIESSKVEIRPVERTVLPLGPSPKSID